MFWLALLTATYLAAVLQTSLSETWALGAVRPDCLALVAITATLLGGNRRLPWSSALVGLAADACLPGRLGPATFAYAAVCLLLGALLQRRLPLRLPAQLAVVVAGVSLTGLMTYGLRWLLGEAVVGPASALPLALGSGLYSASLALPVFLVAGWTIADNRETGFPLSDAAFPVR